MLLCSLGWNFTYVIVSRVCTCVCLMHFIRVVASRDLAIMACLPPLPFFCWGGDDRQGNDGGGGVGLKAVVEVRSKNE